MKAIVRDRYCTPDALTYGDVDLPPVGPKDVLVRVHAAGVDQGVWHLITGMPLLVRAVGFGLRRPKVHGLGEDVAGVVEAIGAEVTRFAVGDEVYGAADASYAEFARTREHRILPKPAALSMAQAATVQVSGVTALKALHGLKAGERVAVTGAGGGVGSFAVQIAKARGAHVTAVCRAAKHEFARGLGADEADTDLPAGAVFDRIVVTAGGRSLARLRAALTPTGTLVLVGGEGFGGPLLQGFTRQIRMMLLNPLTKQTLTPLLMSEDENALRELHGLVEEGRVTPAVDRTYPLPDTAAAIAYLRTAEVRGKLAITV